MKTVLITIDYKPSLGGVATYYTKLKKYWPEEALEVLDNTNSRLLAKKGPLRWRRAFFRVLRQVNRRDYLIAGQILPMGTICLLLNILQKRKYAVILHGMDFTLALKKKRKKFLSKLILRKAHRIICGNSYTAGLVKDFLKENCEKIKVVNPGIDLADFNNFGSEDLNRKSEALKKEYNLENKFILLSLGRLVKRKGVDEVLESLKLINEQKDDIVYIVAGKGCEAEYLKEKAKGVGVRVVFIENFSDDVKWQLYNLSDVFIMPAREIAGDFEGFGIVYLEANMFKKPVIAGNSGGVGDAVKNGVNGFLVNPVDREEIKEAIIRLHKDKELRTVLGENGYRRAKEEFSWEKQAKLLYKYINES